MIGYLKGKIIEKRIPEVWVEVQGVGYRVKVGSRVFEKLTLDEEMALFIHTALRQDALELYGFLTMDDLKMFELLLNVSGVGPKTALTIVGNQPVERIERAVRDADVGFFQAIPGIGKKGAQRIIVDLKGKLPSLKDIDLTDEDENDAVYLALKQFGFNRNEIGRVMKDMDRTMSEQEQVREGLKRLGRR
jgi:Holliday junction DNA helicase RuvA